MKKQILLIEDNEQNPTSTIRRCFEPGVASVFDKTVELDQIIDALQGLRCKKSGDSPSENL